MGEDCQLCRVRFKYTTCSSRSDLRSQMQQWMLVHCLAKTKISQIQYEPQNSSLSDENHSKKQKNKTKKQKTLRVVCPAEAIWWSVVVPNNQQARWPPGDLLVSERQSKTTPEITKPTSLFNSRTMLFLSNKWALISFRRCVSVLSAHTNDEAKSGLEQAISVETGNCLPLQRS